MRLSRGTVKQNSAMSDDLTTEILLLHSDVDPTVVQERQTLIGLDASDIAQLRGGNLQLILGTQREWAANELHFELASPLTSLADASAFNGLSYDFGVNTGVTA